MSVQRAFSMVTLAEEEEEEEAEGSGMFNLWGGMCHKFQFAKRRLKIGSRIGALLTLAFLLTAFKAPTTMMTLFHHDSSKLQCYLITKRSGRGGVLTRVIAT